MFHTRVEVIIYTEAGYIEREDFREIFKRSETLKGFVDSQRRTDHLDKAVLAFKVLLLIFLCQQLYAVYYKITLMWVLIFKRP